MGTGLGLQCRNNNNESTNTVETKELYGNRIDQPKETPDTVDDEFNSNTLDSKWNLIKGIVGVVDPMTESLIEVDSVMDLTTRSRSLLVQTANGKNFEIYQDFTLQDGESIVLSMNCTAQMTQTLPGFIQSGICLGDGNTALSGNYIALKFTSINDGWWVVKQTTGGLQNGAWGDNAAEPALGALTMYYRIARKGNQYQGFYSLDGENWMMANYFTDIGGIANKVFLYSRSSATQTGSPLPITEFGWIRKGSNKISPWGDRPTTPPIMLSALSQNSNEFVVFTFSEAIRPEDLVLGNFNINYSNNGDPVSNVSLLSITDNSGNPISVGTNKFRLYLSYAGDSDGSGNYVISSGTLEDIYGNINDGIATNVIQMQADSQPIESLANVVEYWKAGAGDNSTAPKSKTGTKNSLVMLNNGPNQPTLNGEFWSFNGSGQGFKNADASIINPFKANARDCQLHYVSMFTSASGINRAVMFSDNINNKYLNFFYQNGNRIDFSLGSTSTTFTITNLITIPLNVPLLFSVGFYQDGGQTKVNLKIHDGTNELYSNLGVTVPANTPPNVNGFYWSMREQSGGNKAYYPSSTKEVVVGNSSSDFEYIREQILSNF